MPESEDWPQGRPTTPEPAHRGPDVDRRTGSPAAASRIRQQVTWVDLQVKQAIERGEFDDLPGAGRPIEDLDKEHDPDWWLKRLVEREKITGVLPPSLQLRKDDAALDDLLDQQRTEEAARTLVEAAIRIGATLGLDVVAEGIEDERQRALLAEAGCEIGQGYLFARPMAPQALETWARSRSAADAWCLAAAPEPQAFISTSPHS